MSLKPIDTIGILCVGMVFGGRIAEDRRPLFGRAAEAGGPGPAVPPPIRPAARRGGGAGGRTQEAEGAPLPRQLDAGARGSRGTGMLKGQPQVPTTALPAALRLLCACAVRSLATPCGSCAGGRHTGRTTGCTYQPASTRGGSARCCWVQACASSRRTSRTASGSSRSVRRTCRCPSTCELLLVLSALISA